MIATILGVALAAQAAMFVLWSRRTKTQSQIQDEFGNLRISFSFRLTREACF
jgi:hypothetical protein